MVKDGGRPVRAAQRARVREGRDLRQRLAERPHRRHLALDRPRHRLDRSAAACSIRARRRPIDVLNGIAYDAKGRSPVRHRQAVAAHLRDPGRPPMTSAALLLMLLVHGITAQSPSGRQRPRSGRHSAARRHRAWPKDRVCPSDGTRRPAPTCCGQSPCPASRTRARSSGAIGSSSPARSAAAATRRSSLASTAKGRHPRTARCSAGS